MCRKIQCDGNLKKFAIFFETKGLNNILSYDFSAKPIETLIIIQIPLIYIVSFYDFTTRLRWFYYSVIKHA
jgi:hypothetical protein